MDEEIIVKYNINEKKKEISEKYKNAGVWALWAKDSKGKKVCLEVGKTINIYDEINSALYILSIKDDLKCKQCTVTHDAKLRDRKYSAEFKIHDCKSCEYESKLRSKSWKRNPRYIDKYKDMLLHYQDFQFVLVYMGANDIREIEKEYAVKHQALYWQS